ncbi:MAG: penicillin-binding protein activator [Alphaproteobacteria bacterium]|nr:penicillin-binding protein activator [Alphaproteobacteria bacterium]
MTRTIALAQGARKTFAALGALAFVALFAACAGDPFAGTLSRGEPRTERAPMPDARGADAWQPSAAALLAPHMQGREPVRVGLLLPLTAANPSVSRLGNALFDAAELAVFQINNPNLLLMPQDTQGTSEGARAAATRAIEDGAEILLGPLFAEEVSAVAPVAASRAVPVVAFSSDRAVAGPGTFLLSFSAEDEVERVTRFAVSQGLTQIAALVPQGTYGSRVENELMAVAGQTGAQVVDVVFYYPGAENFLEPTKQLADAYKQGYAVFDAVLIPEGGTSLRGLVPLLPYYDIDNRKVRFLGTGLWDDPSLWREPSLYGGWFAAPDPRSRAGFVSRFAEVNGHAPERIATLAFDAVTLAAALADGAPGQRYTPARISDPNGFFGLDGIFRFRPDGTIERGLAVLEVNDGRIQIVSPAPDRFDVPPLGF